MVVATAAPPRIQYVQRYRSSLGQEAIECAALAGLEMDWHQQLVLDAGCAIEKKRWKHFEVGVCEPRQNGKNAILIARELAGLFAWDEKLIIHSAHQFDTSREHFLWLVNLIEDTPEFDSRVRRILRSHGEEGIELLSGGRIRFRTRTSGGGRGFSCDTLILDEAMYLTEASYGALLPVTSARKNPQLWYTGTAVDQEIQEHGLVFTRLRERALQHSGDSLAYFEWSLDYGSPDDVPEEILTDPDAWARVNPALGDRIREEHVAKELAALDRRTFAVEILGVGDWPDPSGVSNAPISSEQWGACEDPNSKLRNPVCLAFDSSPERRTSISAAGKNADGRWQIEVLEKRPGTHWLPARLVELKEAHDPQAVVYDSIGPAASMASEIEALGVKVEALGAAEHAQACGRLVDAVAEDNLRHLGSLDLWNAIRGARTRQLGDRWAWSRKSSSIDISPLVSATLALWAAMGQPEDNGEVQIY